MLGVSCIVLSTWMARFPSAGTAAQREREVRVPEVPGHLPAPRETKPHWGLFGKINFFFSPRNFSSGKENLSNNYTLYVFISCWKSNKIMDFSFSCISEWHAETNKKVPFQTKAFSSVPVYSENFFLFSFVFSCSFNTFLSFHTEEWETMYSDCEKVKTITPLFTCWERNISCQTLETSSETMGTPLFRVWKTGAGILLK